MAMDKDNILLLICLFFVLFEGGLGAQDPPVTRVVNITNDLGSRIKLVVHCNFHGKFHDENLGLQTLSFHHSFSHSFKSDDVTPKTRLFCFFWWKNGNNDVFDLYNPQRDDPRFASKYSWSIRREGAYSYDEKKHQWDLLYTWKK
ncbi:hypothetical protein ACFX13_034503 [Malus domestica]|nr:S-protein homolog 2-like [Malus domestica]XP_028957540.1 S-protein homolog 2-like [Malus domestica]